MTKEEKRKREAVIRHAKTILPEWEMVNIGEYKANEQHALLMRRSPSEPKAFSLRAIGPARLGALRISIWAIIRPDEWFFLPEEQKKAMGKIFIEQSAHRAPHVLKADFERRLLGRYLSVRAALEGGLSRVYPAEETPNVRTVDVFGRDEINITLHSLSEGLAKEILTLVMEQGGEG
jgi:hypothetical protein